MDEWLAGTSEWGRPEEAISRIVTAHEAMVNMSEEPDPKLMMSNANISAGARHKNQ